MDTTLSGRGAPEAVGAILMLMRFCGESPAEIAGFVDAMRARRIGPTRPPRSIGQYAAGRSRGLPWFLLSARLMAQAEFPVLLHGWNSHPGMADPRQSLVDETRRLPDAPRLIVRIAARAAPPCPAR